VRRAAAALVGALAAGAAALAGCGTCRPDAPPVRPSVGGSVGVGSGGGFYHSTGVGLDVSNLFCRAPAPQPPPTPGTPPLPGPDTAPQRTPTLGTPPLPDPDKAPADQSR
jgi:hypothetical protein